MGHTWWRGGAKGGRRAVGRQSVDEQGGKEGELIMQWPTERTGENGLVYIGSSTVSWRGLPHIHSYSGTHNRASTLERVVW